MRFIAKLLCVSIATAFVSPVQAAEGCYLSRPYADGIRDTLAIKKMANGYQFNFSIAYCNQVDDPKCLGVKVTNYAIEMVMRGNRYSARASEKNVCGVSAVQINERRIVVSQAASCSLAPYWGVHGVYTLEDAGQSASSCMGN